MAAVRLTVMRMAVITSLKYILIESPFAGEVDENLAYAQKCMRHVFFERAYVNQIPIASHCFFTLALDDREEGERRMGMEAGFAMRGLASEVRVYLDRGISSGMIHGIRGAIEVGKPITLWAFKPEEVTNEALAMLRVLPASGQEHAVRRAMVREAPTANFGGPMPDRLEAAARAAGSKLRHG